MRLQWLPASQIRIVGLAKQQSQQSQNRQAGSQGPGFSYGLQILFSAIIEMLYDSKIFLKSNNQSNIKVKYLVVEGSSSWIKYPYFSVAGCADGLLANSPTEGLDCREHSPQQQLLG